jgi:hypothetical protein
MRGDIDPTHNISEHFFRKMWHSFPQLSFGGIFGSGQLSPGADWLLSGDKGKVRVKKI